MTLLSPKFFYRVDEEQPTNFDQKGKAERMKSRAAKSRLGEYGRTTTERGREDSFHKVRSMKVPKTDSNGLVAKLLGNGIYQVTGVHGVLPKTLDRRGTNKFYYGTSLVGYSLKEALEALVKYDKPQT